LFGLFFVAQEMGFILFDCALIVSVLFCFDLFDMLEVVSVVEQYYLSNSLVVSNHSALAKPQRGRHKSTIMKTVKS